jgi:hypothetical protein
MVSGTTFDQLHEQLTGIVNMFEKSKTDAQSAIAQASSLREQIDRMTETALEAAASRAHNIEDSAYSALRTHIAANFDELSRRPKSASPRFPKISINPSPNRRDKTQQPRCSDFVASF